ncbi:MAG: hypothetical protein CV089_00425 [Nitrospira sp. WS110]|nr:hypothetical protein [Nitrospira sp. WS110]
MMTVSHLSRPRPQHFSNVLGHKPSLQTVSVLCLVLIVAGSASMDGKSTGSPGFRKASSKPKPKQEIALRTNSQLLPGDRTVLGTVEAIQGKQIKVEYADSLQPRYSPY